MDALKSHADCVDDWLSSVGIDVDSVVFVDLFQSAMTAAHARVSSTLGEITLRAITDRVVHIAAEEFPFLSTLRVQPDGAVKCDELRRQAQALLPTELRQGIRLVLVELLTVIGSLTAEVLSRDLHDALRRSADPSARPPRSAGKRARTPRLKDS